MKRRNCIREAARAAPTYHVFVMIGSVRVETASPEPVWSVLASWREESETDILNGSRSQSQCEGVSERSNLSLIGEMKNCGATVASCPRAHSCGFDDPDDCTPLATSSRFSRHTTSGWAGRRLATHFYPVSSTFCGHCKRFTMFILEQYMQRNPIYCYARLG